MKIVYISPSRDNLGNHDHRFIKSFLERGVKVHLVSYHWDDIDPRTLELEGLEITHKRSKFFKRLQAGFYPHRIFHFRRLLQRVSPDLIISTNIWNHGFFAALSGFHPAVLMPFGSDILVHPKKYRFIKWLNRYAIVNADVINCDAEHIKTEIMSTYGYPERRIIVFPRGVILKEFKPMLADSAIRKKLGWERKIILIMNRHFEPIYGIEYFIEALKEVIRQRSEVRIFLIGSGSLLKKAKQTVSEMGLNEFVHFVGRIPNSQMVEFLNAADIYVSCSLSDGTPVSLLEAMASGKPVICSDLPSIREWIEHGRNGLLYPSRDVQQLVKEIINLVDNREMRTMMGKQNLSVVRERADWNKNVDTMLERYRSIIEETKRRN